MRQFKAKIISNKKIAPEHYILSFKEPQIAKNIKPGQFFNIRISDSYDPLLRRPFSLHNIEGDKIFILYKAVGKATDILSKKEKGEMLDVIGPIGNGFDIQASGNPPSPRLRRAGRQQATVILVAGGHGVAPLYALAKKLTAHSSQLTAFIGARTSKHIVCDKEFKKLGAKMHIATEDGSAGYKGVVTELLKTELRRTKDEGRRTKDDRRYTTDDRRPTTDDRRPTTDDIRPTIYACGPKPMLKAVAQIAHKYGIACQVSMEEYLACGIGVCMGCVIKTKSGNKLVCKDGPVFDSREIIW